MDLVNVESENMFVSICYAETAVHGAGISDPDAIGVLPFRQNNGHAFTELVFLIDR